MINRTANKIGKALADPVADSKYFYDKFSHEQLEQIITFNLIGNIKQGLWVLALIILAVTLNFLGIDIRFTTFVIFITFVSFRRKFGGYHADSQIACLIISTVIVVVLAFIATVMDFNIYFIFAVYIFAYYTAYKKGVVDHPNRRFSNENKILNLEMKQRLFKIGVRLLIIVNVIHILLYITGHVVTSNAILLGVFISFANLYFGK
ncbi:accessory gene regulator B family protein [Wukongibacter sp. M2B1]|uniref:accessory gene regulator B family protein n=1 Tax=Wukongibacter sp. M2B1 TaxID=3088895 RepID=UPI003D7AA05B